MTPLWHVPIVVAALLSWLATPPSTLAEAAQRESVRRMLIGKTTATYTNLDLPVGATWAMAPASGDDDADAADEPDDAAPNSESGEPKAEAASGSATRDEAWWGDRAAELRVAIERAKTLAGEVQGRINALTAEIVNRDDPFQQAELRDQLQKALAELDRAQASALDAQQRLEALQQEARRAGVPPGWLR